MTTPSELPTTVFEPARLARLSRGLLTTLRSLGANRGSDEWTGVSVNKKLAIQRFYKDFEAWIRELEALSASRSDAPPTDNPSTADNVCFFLPAYSAWENDSCCGSFILVSVWVGCADSLINGVTAGIFQRFLSGPWPTIPIPIPIPAAV